MVVIVILRNSRLDTGIPLYHIKTLSPWHVQVFQRRLEVIKKSRQRMAYPHKHMLESSIGKVIWLVSYRQKSSAEF